MSQVVLSGLTSADIYCRACSFIFGESSDVKQGMQCCSEIHFSDVSCLVLNIRMALCAGTGG